MNNTHDDFMIQMLQEKLEWYFTKAGLEDFKPDMVVSLCKTLDFIEPLPDAKNLNAFDRFLLRYHSIGKMSI